MSPSVPSTKLAIRRAWMICGLSATAVLACCGLMTAAVLAPPPVGILPLLLVVCSGLPVLAAYELRDAVTVLGARRQLSRLRRELEELPETPHPLGL